MRLSLGTVACNVGGRGSNSVEQVNQAFAASHLLAPGIGQEYRMCQGQSKVPPVVALR